MLLAGGSPPRHVFLLAQQPAGLSAGKGGREFGGSRQPLGARIVQSLLSHVISTK
jgi:hypothetical protein